ncbi:MAG: type II toxin-antitoxin system RelE/ParE family toxin [Candidatus Eisenbacteria bacterium]
MKHRVEFTPRAARDLRGLDRREQRRLLARIERLAEEPRPNGARKIEGEDGLYRVRQGVFRILYRVEDARLLVLVIRIRHRQDVYR